MRWPRYTTTLRVDGQPWRRQYALWPQRHGPLWVWLDWVWFRGVCGVGIRDVAHVRECEYLAWEPSPTGPTGLPWERAEDTLRV